MAVINRQKPDHVPSGFWLHFPSGYEEGQIAADMHLKFFKESGTDLCKIMNEHLLPQDFTLRTPQDWSHIKPFDKKADYIQKQIDLVKRVVDGVAGEAVVLATVHGITSSLSHVLGGPGLFDRDKLFQVKHLRENPSGMRAGVEAIAEILAYIAQESIAAGADGIYYASLGGEKYGYSDEEFRDYIRYGDLIVLEAAKNRPCFNVLHICKDNIELNRFEDYPCEVVNWGVYSDNLSLEEGRKRFPGKVILGGLDDRSGVLVDGTEEEIETAVDQVIDSFGNTGFILGADCTLPTEIDLARIRCAVRAAAKH